MVVAPRPRTSRSAAASRSSLAVNPWVGAEANANVAKVLMEQQLGCTVELKNVNEKAQFPGMADGTIDATLEVWPSGHSTDREQYIDDAGTVVDGGLLGITGNIGWFVPSYVVEQNPEFATWEGFEENADIFATAETGDKGRFLGADTTYSIFDEQIIEALGLDLEVVYTGSEPATLAALDTAVQNEEPILMYWWTPQWANAKYDLVEVELPAVHRRVRGHRAERPEAKGYDCDYADDVCTRRSAPSSRPRTPRPSSSSRTSAGRRRSRTASRRRSRKVKDGEDAAQTWIDANEATWQAWLPAAS